MADENEKGRVPGIFDYAPASRSTAESVRRSLKLKRTLDSVLAQLLKKTLPREVIRAVGRSYHHELFGKFCSYVFFDNPILAPGILYLGWGDWNAFGKLLHDEEIKSPEGGFERQFVNAARTLLYDRMGLRPPAEGLLSAMAVKKRESFSFGSRLPYRLVELVADNLADYIAANLPAELRGSFAEFDRKRLSVAKDGAYWDDLAKKLTILAIGWYDTGQSRRWLLMPWRTRPSFERSVYEIRQNLDAARIDSPLRELAAELGVQAKRESEMIARVLESYYRQHNDSYLVVLLGARSEAEARAVIRECSRLGVRLVTVAITEPGS